MMRSKKGAFSFAGSGYRRGMSDIFFSTTLMSGGLVVWNSSSMVASFHGIDLDAAEGIQGG
jgi:hypothetical protein